VSGVLIVLFATQRSLKKSAATNGHVSCKLMWISMAKFFWMTWIT
jgi:hypothetical protein